MLQHPLLQTKLYVPPIRPEVVSRPRLLERLNAGLPARNAFLRALTLISAPAGFGKTTLVSEWVQAMGGSTLPIAIAWLSLDKGDNDPARFLAYLIAALRIVEANMGKGVLGALQSPEVPPVEDILTVLINEVAGIPGRIILVLDDYHMIEAEEIHDAVTFLLEHLPPQMHLVIATRDDPRLPFARLRARGQLTELRASDLRFTSSEAAEFLNQMMGLDLSAEDIAALETRTEGWIAGLHLQAPPRHAAALAMQGTLSMHGNRDTSSFIKSFTGSHRFVLDYLIEEVLEQQPASVQTCLLRTAILDRLTASLCDAVCSVGTASGSQGTAGRGRAFLEELDRANLFLVPLDEERRWYRYHHLFADLLRQRLRQTRPEWVPVLHERASVWHEQNGFIYEAIEHALHAKDFERAASLIEQHVDQIWQRGEHAKLRRWLGELPGESVYAKPHLCILRAWDQFTSGQQDAAEQSLQVAERVLEIVGVETGEIPSPDRGRLSDSDRRKIQGRAAAIRAFLAFYRGDAQATREYAQQALELLPEQDMTWRSTATVALGDAYAFVGDLAGAQRVRSEAVEAGKAAGNTYMVLIASMKLAVTLRLQGKLEQVLEICQQQLQLANESGLSQTVVTGWLLAIWGEVLAERNDPDGAIEKARKGTELTAKGKDLAMLGWSYLCLMRILLSRGDLTGAQETIESLEKVAEKSYVPPWITNQMATWQARIWLAQGRLDAASQWAEERELELAGAPAYLREQEHITLARILIAQGRLNEADRKLQRLLEGAEARGQTSRELEILNVQALVAQAKGDTIQAIALLEQALTLAKPGGFVRAFVDEGPQMARLLFEAASRGTAPDYARRLLAAFPTVAPAQTAPAVPPVAESELVEPLSERELEVLQLIAEGLTNREIASRLFLSLNTVKAHTRNIYGKLGTHNRTQAVARARALGGLPPI